MRVLPHLQCLWPRRAPRPITHTLVCGASRSGKSEAELVRLVAMARGAECSIVLLDPPGTLGTKFLLHLHALGLTDRVIYDRLRDSDRVPCYHFLTPSPSTDALQREAENDERIREFASILLRRRGIQDPAKTPLIEEVLLVALRLYIFQDSPVPLYWLADVFDLRSQARAQLLAHCTDPELVRRFHEYASLSPTARRAEIAPGERILRAVLRSPAFHVRCGSATFDFDRFLDEAGILILDGSSRGNLSRDAASVIMGAVILKVIAHCRNGSRSKVVLVLDEAVNAGLIGLHESRALAEAGKWGLEVHILIQDPFNFESEEIRRNVLQNTWRHEWFRQGNPEAARLAAEDIALPLLNPLRVHHTEYRVRTRHAGYERIETTSRRESSDTMEHVRSRSRSWNTVLWPRHQEVTDAQDRYVALQDQVLLMQKQLLLLQPGYRFVRADRVSAQPEYVPMLRVPRGAFAPNDLSVKGASDTQRAEGAAGGILRALKERPLYHTPIMDSPPGTVAVPRGAVERLRQGG